MADNFLGWFFGHSKQTTGFNVVLKATAFNDFAAIAGWLTAALTLCYGGGLSPKRTWFEVQLKSSEGKFSHLTNLVIFEATEASSPSCRRFLRWLSRSVRRTGSASSIAYLLIPILVSTVFPVSSVHCQETVGGQATDETPLIFLVNGQRLTNSPATLGPVKEGHATVQWSRHPDASGYRLVNEQGVTVYEGRFNRAFVSGLNNGSHSFRIVALDEAQRPIVTGRESLTILVDHWDRRLTLGLFSLGAVVLFFVGLVLGVGAMRANTASDSADSANSNEEAGR